MTRMLYSSMLCLLASITLVAGGVSIADAAQRGGTSATTAGDEQTRPEPSHPDRHGPVTAMLCVPKTQIRTYW
jgi:hypothetical protein